MLHDKKDEEVLKMWQQFGAKVEREGAAIYAVLNNPIKRHDEKLLAYAAEAAMQLGTSAAALLNTTQHHRTIFRLW